MSARVLRLALIGALLALPETLQAQQSPARFSLILNGALDLATLDFSASRTFDLYIESAQLDSRYEISTGTGFDGGLQFNITPLIGVMASGSVSDRDAAVEFAASLPHPLFFDQPRSVSGGLMGLSYKEQLAHLSLTIGGTAGKLEFTGFGGVTFFKIEADLARDVDFDEIYPFDTATITGASQVKVEDSPVGFHVGGRLDYRFSSPFGLGVQLRFSQAKAELVIPDVTSIEFDAGGAQATAGIRLYF